MSFGAGTVTVGTGIDLINFYGGLAARGRAVPGGSCPTVGIAGLTLGGGVGVLSRIYGLTCDNLRSLDIVTADGTTVTCNHSSNRGLYWASRGGGGGNFGVATSFTFGTHNLTQAWSCSPWAGHGRGARKSRQRLAVVGAARARRACGPTCTCPLPSAARRPSVSAAASSARWPARAQSWTSSIAPGRIRAYIRERRRAHLPQRDAAGGGLPQRSRARLRHAARRQPAARAVLRQVRLLHQTAERGRHHARCSAASSGCGASGAQLAAGAASRSTPSAVR